MKRFISIHLIMIFFLGCTTNSNNTVKLEKPRKGTKKSLYHGINQMGWNVIKKIAGELDKTNPDNSDKSGETQSAIQAERNIIISPYSIAAAFSLAWAGAKNKTEKELAEFFNSTIPYPEQHKILGALQQSLSQTEGFKLKLANSIWLEKTMEVEQTWLDNIKSWYGIKPRFVDFINKPQEVTDAINKWVANKTNNRINNLIPENTFHELSRAVLANAIWFLAKWETPFRKKTIKREFYPADNWKIKTDTMTGTINGKMAKLSNGAQMVSLPYKGGRFSFIIYLPPSGLSLESTDHKMLQKLIYSLNSKRFLVFLPKFELKASYKLGSILKKIIPLSFSRHADFSRITKEKPGLVIDDVFHKTLLKVDEKGTEAAAASAITINQMVSTRSKTTPVPKVHINRPFLFWIRDNKTGLDIFSGRIINPNPKAKLLPHNPSR